MLLETLRAAAPDRCEGEPSVALLSSGWEDAAWFEHTFLAAEMGIALVQPSDLSFRDGKLLWHSGSDVRPVDVLYARMDEDMLLSSTRLRRCSAQGRLARRRRKRDTLTIANALGNGIGDDKAIYAYVPAMIEYYLGEKPALAQVPTWICAERAQRDYVLDHLPELVVKPIDGFGGSGVVIGPDASPGVLQARRTGTGDPAGTLHRTGGGCAIHPPHVRRRGDVPAPRRSARVRAPASGRRACRHGARHAGRVDPGGGARIPDRQLIVRRWQQGHVDIHQMGGTTKCLLRKQNTSCAVSAAKSVSTVGPLMSPLWPG